jgi:hypothetical protein
MHLNTIKKWTISYLGEQGNGGKRVLDRRGIVDPGVRTSTIEPPALESIVIIYQRIRRTTTRRI